MKLDIAFQGVFDNREFFSPYNIHETIIGGRTSISLGNRKDSIHKFRFGISDFYNYGTRPRAFAPDLLMYYRYNFGNWTGYFGAFPEGQLFKAPRAILSDLHHYYNPTVEGLLLQYKSDKYRQLMYIDWISSQDSITRECILFAGEGDVKIKDWGFEHYWQIIHNGYTKAHNGSIEDYVSAAWLVSYDFSNKVPWHTLMLKSGMLYSLWRDRALFDDFHFAASWYSELELGYRRLFMKSVFHLGEKQMLYLGDLFYRNTRQYSRTDLGIDLIKSHRARVRVLWSFHVANGDFENQQMLSVLFKV